MSHWSSKFRPHVELDLPEGWSVEEYEDCASFASDAAVMIVDLNAHEMPESDLVGMLAILMRSPGLKVFALDEVVVGDHRGWRFEADVIEDMTYDDVFGESADEGDRTVVHVVGVADHVVAIHATAHGARFPQYADDVARLVASIRFGDRDADKRRGHERHAPS